MTRLVLNMILKNEAARIERCLRSIAPFITEAFLHDTGSTDNTIELAVATLAKFGVETTTTFGEFRDFSHARNEALNIARDSIRRSRVSLNETYILMCDADMELVSEPGAFDNLTAPAYLIEQRAGINYMNTRLVRADVPAIYKFPTHEWLDVSGVEPLRTCHFIDHADGANRPGKMQRDLDMLLAELEKDPKSQRGLFYCAQTYSELGMHGLAAITYDKRAEAGGWVEEIWYSTLRAGRSYLAAGNRAEGVLRLLQAHQMRPTRAEAAYSLAAHFRERSEFHAALPFALAAISIPYPASDSLFVEKSIYDIWARFEFSVSAFYSTDPVIRERGRIVAEELAVQRGAPGIVRYNLAFSTRKLVEIAPSFKAWRLPWTPPEGWSASNPGLTATNNRVHVMIRSGNYTLHPDGSFTAPPGENVHTRLYLTEWMPGDGVTLVPVREVAKPVDWPDPLSTRVQGFEDPRLNYRDDALWISATMMERTPEGYCEIWVARIDEGGGLRLANAAAIVPVVDAPRNQKNVVPIDDGSGRFLYLHDPARVISTAGATLWEREPKMALDHLRGGSPLIPFDDGYLSMTHEVCHVGGALRKYLHRWVFYDAEAMPVKASRTFSLAGEQYEYCGGLAWSPWEAGVLLGCFGCWDREAYVFQVRADEVRKLLVLS